MPMIDVKDETARIANIASITASVAKKKPDSEEAASLARESATLRNVQKELAAKSGYAESDKRAAVISKLASLESRYKTLIAQRSAQASVDSGKGGGSSLLIVAMLALGGFALVGSVGKRRR